MRYSNSVGTWSSLFSVVAQARTNNEPNTPIHRSAIAILPAAPAPRGGHVYRVAAPLVPAPCAEKTHMHPGNRKQFSHPGPRAIQTGDAAGFGSIPKPRL